MNAQDANSNSTDAARRPSWKWSLADLERVPKNGYRVFSCFSCAGGSSFGYKLAGFDVVGNVEIDTKINEIYKANHHPKHNFNMDIRDFKKLQDIPAELYGIDILDGSPPCTSFSTSGNREKDWGKRKKFAEGGKLQTLDDLFLDFLDVAEKLKPKIIIAENVQGLIKGNAKGYCNMILKRFAEVGYDTQMFLLNSATMGVPQSRPRVFFIARRRELKLPNIKLEFNEPPILFGTVRGERGDEMAQSKAKFLLGRIMPTEKHLGDVHERLFGKSAFFSWCVIDDGDICNTIQAGACHIRRCDKTMFTNADYLNVSTFPQDFICDKNKIVFACGMSVPPIMMHRIAEQIKSQWLDVLAASGNSDNQSRKEAA